MRIEPIPDWGFQTTDDDWEELYCQVPSRLSHPRREWYIRYRTVWWHVDAGEGNCISFDDARKLILLAS